MGEPASGPPGTRKRFRGGTHRVLPPAETVARVSPLMPVMGITRIANITGLDSVGLPVVTVCRPNARSLAVSAGKGLDLDAARASGLMEAVELFHAERITRPLKLATRNELRYSHPLIDVSALPRLSVGSFHDDSKLLWIEGFDLLGEAPVWLPYETVHLNFTLPLPTGSGSFIMSSNGLASGNHRLEAISHGLCEVIERDAMTLFHLDDDGAQEQRRLDLETVDDPACANALGLYRRAGVAVAVWEATSDVGVPAYFCRTVDANSEPLRPQFPSFGSGCHPVREVALLRALTEAAQVRLLFIAGSREEVVRADYRLAQDAGGLERARRHVQRSGARRFSEGPTFSGDTLEEDLAFVYRGLRRAGVLEVAHVDLTWPELGIPVARVVVPGLEGPHQAPGFVPGPRARRVLSARMARSTA